MVYSFLLHHHHLHLLLLLLDRPRYDEAAKLHLQALASQRRTMPGASLELIESLNNLAGIYGKMQRHHDALPLQEEVIEVRKKIVPLDELAIAASMHSLARTFRELGKYAEVQ
jgi:hypothetical protein